MSYLTEQEKKEQAFPAAYSSQKNINQGNSLMPPPLQFSLQSGSSSTQSHDWAADYSRLLNDDINFVNESEILGAKLVMPEDHGKYRVYHDPQTKEPWFIGEIGNQFYQPYTQGYRDLVKPVRKIEQQKYVQFNSAKLKVLSEGSPLTVDSGGTIGVNGNKLGFEFNVADGSFAIKTDLLPLGELSGNIWKFPSCGLEAEFKPQLGLISFDPSNYSFEIEITIPGAPLSPAIILGGKLNQPLIKEDFEHLITREFFPFIGELLDALNQ
ncbi:hypothetical protein [Portibacter marinus]|uniref:hypothetical protein n=1 Tax=Portibacter marinus TaxID=2898660 RepID=UPI001F46443F|nr:hypothetical protein [Portibacter marinus]